MNKNDFELNEKSHDYWISYSDMMACLILMFVLIIMLLVFIHTEDLQNSIQVNDDIKNELKTSEQKLESIIGIRKKLIKDLRDQFQSSDLQLDIDPESGAITFSDSVLFDYDSHTISPQGQEYLQKFIPRYIEVLLSNENRDNISQIIVEGHTDNTGSYIYNLELSQKRAFSVVTYILGEEFPKFKKKEMLRDYLTSNGRSFSQLKICDGEVDLDSSRRVEFKFRLKEDEMINEMEAILRDVN